MAEIIRTMNCVVVVILGLLGGVGCNNVTLPTVTCDKFHETYLKAGLNTRQIPADGLPGTSLVLCPSSRSCCSQSLENSLKSLSQKTFQRKVQETLSLVKGTFSSGTSKFDEFFSVLLDNSRQDLHEMFVQTYGLLYQQNAQIFRELFTDLKAYYKGKKLNLTDALHEFFVRLLRRMFQLLNADSNFTSQYLDCVVRHMKDLKPFGEVPDNLSKQVKRAFVAARTFVQGLAIGRDVILAIADIPPTEECAVALMKMLHCPRCRGITDAKPCSNYCLNTMKGCLAHQQELNTAWNDYISALIMVAQRLEGPFNIESVVEPIDVKISDAIMNFQNNGATVSKRVFQGCGTPELGRRKREAKPDAKPNDGIQKLAFGKDDWDKTKAQAKPTTALGTSLDRLVRAIKSKIQLSKDYWNQLPYSVCNDESLSAKMDDELNCWNGKEKARYTANIQKDGVPNNGDNPEVTVKQKGNPVVILQIDKLKIITNKLQSAYSGYDVEWIDVDVQASSGSGSGSGDTDGDGDDDGEASGSGDSGSGVYTYNPDDNNNTKQKTRHNKNKGKTTRRKKTGRENNNNKSQTKDKNEYYFVVTTVPPHLRTPETPSVANHLCHDRTTVTFGLVLVSLFYFLA